MGKSQLETTSSCLFPHRHLKSETYRSLTQILSRCYGHSQVSTPLEPRPESSERGELFGLNYLVSENCGAEKDTVADETFEAVGLEDKGIGDARMVIDEIEHMMDIEENDSLLKKKDLMDGDSADGNDSLDRGCNRQQMLMDELEHVMKGNGELVRENSFSFSAASMGENQSGVAALMNGPEVCVDVEQIVNEESEKEAQLQVDKGHCNLQISGPFDSSAGRSMDSQISKPSGDSEDGSSLLRTNPLELQHEMQQKEMRLEKLARADCTMGSQNYIAEDVEVEEGEISGGFEVGEASIDMLFDDAVVSKEKKDDEKSEDIIDKRNSPCNDQNRADETFSQLNSFAVNAIDCANSDRADELKKIVNNEKQFESENVVPGASMMATDADMYNSVPAAGRNKRKASEDEKGIGSPAAHLNSPTIHGEILEQSPNRKQGITSKEKLDSGVCNKKKRSTLSKERKAKKKQRERKKRAEKNRQLGVKRLKLRPVMKPKTVTYCRHYLMGRCQEGDKCKFSHDTVPLTKSKPCCHFARNSCMKGDDCPFDHQLSKYPCNNFMVKGFCNRGDDCMFSHKMPSKEETQSSSGASKNELKAPSLLHVSNSQKLPNIDRVSHQNVDGLSSSGKVSSSKNKELVVAENPMKPPALAPKGISCFFLGKSSVVESSKSKQGSSSPKRNEGSKVGKQTEQSALGTFQNMGETPKRTLPAVASKGVNFLSFGNPPLEDSTSKKLAGLLLNRENGVKPSLLNNFNVHKQASSSCNGERSAKVGNQTTQSVSSAIEKSNEMLKITHPALTPQGLNLHSIGKALTDGSISDKQASFSSSLDKEATPDKNSAIPQRPPASLFATGHSLDHFANGHYKSTPNSSQKALLSTLAFAAKIETEMKINSSAVGSGANNQTRGNRIGGSGAGSSGGLLNDSAKASKILEFLSGIGNKSVNT